MKKLIVTLSIFALVGCCTEIETAERAWGKKSDYDSQCVVGSRYTICGPKSNNPFEKQDKATVIIVDKKKGYVLYCWDFDFNKPDRVTFTRSCEEFVDLINLCK